MKSYSELERTCEATFFSSGPYWHAYTSGKDTSVLFVTDEDFCFVLNVIAMASVLYPGLTILAFEVMNNHFHFVISGDIEDIIAFWSVICRKLARFFPSVKGLELKYKQIDSLTSIRNNIVYTNRNGYVALSDQTPYSYPWGTGHYFFQDIIETEKYSEIRVERRRKMYRGRAAELPEDWKITRGHISAASFCSIKCGMSMFRDAHHYFSLLSKNVEAYSELAFELGESDYLTDSELISLLLKTVRETYSVSGIKQLSKAQKLEFARSLHYDRHCSNGQIHRVLGLSLYEVDSLFPLSVRND